VALLVELNVDVLGVVVETLSDLGMGKEEKGTSVISSSC